MIYYSTYYIIQPFTTNCCGWCGMNVLGCTWSYFFALLPPRHPGSEASSGVISTLVHWFQASMLVLGARITLLCFLFVPRYRVPALSVGVILPHLHRFSRQEWPSWPTTSGPGKLCWGRGGGNLPSCIARCILPSYGKSGIINKVHHGGDGGRSNPKTLVCLMTSCIGPARSQRPSQQALLYRVL